MQGIETETGYDVKKLRGQLAPELIAYLELNGIRSENFATMLRFHGVIFEPELERESEESQVFEAEPSNEIILPVVHISEVESPALELDESRVVENLGVEVTSDSPKSDSSESSSLGDPFVKPGTITKKGGDVEPAIDTQPSLIGDEEVISQAGSNNSKPRADLTFYYFLGVESTIMSQYHDSRHKLILI